MGDAIELKESEAKRLMTARVVQSEPVPKEDIVPDFVPRPEDAAQKSEAAKPEAGGDTAQKTGEPSMDGGNTERQNTGGILGRFRKQPDAPTDVDTKADPSAGM